jgi:hypothetical protein
MNSLRARLDPDWLVAHRHLVAALLDRTHRVATALFVLTFAGYGVAVLVWFQGNSWMALLIATLSFFFFRQFRALSLGIARLPLRGQVAALPLLQAIDAGLEKASARELVLELEDLRSDWENVAKS